MRLAVHSSALSDIFSGNCNSVMASVVLSSRIAITPTTLGAYQAGLGTHLGYQAWFAAMSTANRITVHQPQDAPPMVQAREALTDGYASAAYFGASLLVAEAAHFSAAALTGVSELGTRLLSTQVAMAGAIPGDNPCLAIGLAAGGTADFSVLEQYVLPEESLVVYDKYINEAACQLLEYLVGKLRPGAVVQVFKSNRNQANLLATNAILTRLGTANPHVTVSCKNCSATFLSLEHDRYIFFGNRLQMVFTVGLDSFGLLNPATGLRQNRRSRILVYDTTAGTPLDIHAADGTVCTVTQVS